MEGTSAVGLMGASAQQYENDNHGIPLGEDGYGSGSENYDNGDDSLDGSASGGRTGKRKKYHRHNPQQIQELENFFKDCPHPDEKQRLELGRSLGLESRQVKFWFQNRRTQLKTQMERQENSLLKQEFERLRMENITLKEYMGNPLCKNCGGASLLGEISMEQDRLKLENARLKEELVRVCSFTEKAIGKPVSELVGSLALPPSQSHMDLSMGQRNAFTGGFGGGEGLTLMGSTTLKMENGFLMKSTPPPSSSSAATVTGDFGKAMYLQLAISAMEELLVMTQNDAPLWYRFENGGKEVLNVDEYVKKFSPLGMKSPGFVSDARREANSINISTMDLVSCMMDAGKWVDMFSSIVAKAATIDIICSGVNGTHDGEMLLMNAEFYFPSPLLPPRQAKFIRYCKQHSEGLWAVVDVSVDSSFRESSFQEVPKRCKRLPSGCIIQDVTNGYSLVTWYEHCEHDESVIHHLYRPLLQSGLAFGAPRWLAIIQKYSECNALLVSGQVYPQESALGMNIEGRRSIMKLARRLMKDYCTGICYSSSSSARRWEKLNLPIIPADLQVMTRVSLGEPGEQSGIVMSVSTSVWMPVSRSQLFNFLRNNDLRGQWDILSNGGAMQEMVRISKNQDSPNCISLLCHPNRDGAGMIALQETWTDPISSVVVYAPIDVVSMTTVMSGGDPDLVALLPSGFVITDGIMMEDKEAVGGGGGGLEYSSSSILTMGFQILMSSSPTAKLTVESVDTMNSLIGCTIDKIKNAIAASM